MAFSKREQAAASFRLGVQRHQAGALAEAEAAYRQALSLRPNDTDFLDMMGILAHQTGRGDLAVRHFRKAASLAPAEARHHLHLAAALRDLGRAEDAVQACRKAVRLKAQDGNAYQVLGGALADLGRAEEAAEALATARRLNPVSAEAANELGNVLNALARSEEAAACFEDAIRLNPNDPVPYNNLGLALRGLNRTSEAIAAFRSALRLRPDYINALSNLGLLLQEVYDYTEAETCLAKAATLDPGSPETLGNLGLLFYNRRHLRDAVKTFRRGLELAPGNATLTFNLSQAALALGDYPTGWAAFEARWHVPGAAANWIETGAPLWNGRDSLAGKTILLFGEQGHGDTIQFVRYAPILAAHGATVLLLVQPALVSLLGRMTGVAGCFALGETPPPADLRFPIMSLPLALGTTLETIPAGCPYLAADAAAAARWRARTGPLPGRKIGLVWAGDPRPDQPEAHRVDRRRSLQFQQLAPLADVGGVSFVSLQKGSPAVEARGGPPLHDWTDELNSFADTAALVSTLDLVISADTAAAHLAGALGLEVWLLNRFDSCWRWLDGRDDSPWYPRLRQFRQTVPGDWDGVMARVRARGVSHLFPVLIRATCLGGWNGTVPFPASS